MMGDAACQQGAAAPGQCNTYWAVVPVCSNASLEGCRRHCPCAPVHDCRSRRRLHTDTPLPQAPDAQGPQSLPWCLSVQMLRVSASQGRMDGQPQQGGVCQLALEPACNRRGRDASRGSF